MEMKIKDLAIDHPYYMNESNYFSNEAGGEFNTWGKFMNEFRDADIDYNLCIRWDIKPIDDNEIPDERLGYRMQVVIIAQRKGIYMPFQIHRVFDEDVESIIEYLKPHAEYIKKMWQPIQF